MAQQPERIKTGLWPREYKGVTSYNGSVTIEGQKYYCDLYLNEQPTGANPPAYTLYLKPAGQTSQPTQRSGGYKSSPTYNNPNDAPLF